MDGLTPSPFVELEPDLEAEFAHAVTQVWPLRDPEPNRFRNGMNRYRGRFGLELIRPYPNGLYQRSYIGGAGSFKAIILADGPPGEITDLIATTVDGRAWQRIGTYNILGAHTRRWRHTRVYETPLEWFVADDGGICILDQYFAEAGRR